jgi:hypothetical protein
MYDLNKLQPDEKDKLLSELLSRYEGDTSAAAPQAAQIDPGHGDEFQDLQMMEPILKVLEIMIDKMEELESRLEANEKLVVDDLFGGIDKMYNDNLRKQSVDGLRGKYKDLFEPHMGALSELAPGEDIYDALHEILEPLRQGEGWDDEKELGAVSGAAEAIAKKIAAIKGAGVPAGGAVEVTQVSAEPINPENKFMDKVRKMKENATRKGM